MKKFAFLFIVTCVSVWSLHGDAVPKCGFALSMRERPDGPLQMIVPSMAAGSSVEWQGDRRVTTYVFEGRPVVKVRTFETLGKDSDLRYTMEAETASGWFIERMAYPEVKVGFDGSDRSNDRVVLGHSKGGVMVNPMGKPATPVPGFPHADPAPIDWIYNCDIPGDGIAQFAAFWNGDRGVYFSSDDDSQRTQSLCFLRTANGLFFSHVRFGWETGLVKMGYEVSMREVKGKCDFDWQDFAEIYRAWELKKPWGVHLPFAQRKDIPNWMKDAPAMVRFGRQWLERPQDIERYCRWWRKTHGEGPVIAAMWGWEKNDIWWGPDYFPCYPDDETFRKVTKIMRDYDFHPFAWPSGYNWCERAGIREDGTCETDCRDTILKPAADKLCIGRDGQPYVRKVSWLNSGSITAVCGGLKWTRDWWDGVVDELGKRGCDIVQADQIVGGRAPECWSSRHGHPVDFLGPWMAESFRSQLKSMRETLLKSQPEGVVCFEEPNEKLIDLVGLQDYRDMETKADEFAGVFSYLHHGQLPVFQSNHLSEDLYTIAYIATEGQIPICRPNYSDIDPASNALENGGFERLSEGSLKAPEMWKYYSHVPIADGAAGCKPVWSLTGPGAGYDRKSFSFDGMVKKSGEFSLRVSLPEKSKPEAAQLCKLIEDLPEGELVLSVWTKGRGEGRIFWGGSAGVAGEAVLPSSEDWTNVTCRVKAEKGELMVALMAISGTRWFDEAKLLHRDGTEVQRTRPNLRSRMYSRWLQLYRGEGRPFLVDGVRIRAPKLDCRRTCIGNHNVPAVCHAAFRAADGREAVVLANGTREEQKCSFAWSGKSHAITLAPGEMKIVPVGGPTSVSTGVIRDKWVYTYNDLKTDESLLAFSNVVATAAANGLNGALFAFDADYCHSFKPERLARLYRAKEIADQAKIEIIPLVCNVGYGSPVYENPNYLEGEEIADLHYVAGEGGAKFVPQAGNLLVNGGMEEVAANGRVAGWETDAPGVVTFRDTEVRHSGAASLRFEPRNDAKSPVFAIKHAMARAYQMGFEVIPGRRYRLSAWVKTEDVQKADKIRLQVYDDGDKSPYYKDSTTGDPISGARADSRWDVAKSTMDWRKIAVDFSAGATNRMNAYVGSWGSGSGKFWMDDLELVEIGHRSVITNDGCRVSVRNAKTGEKYVEGKDFLPLGIFKKGERPWRILDGEPVLPLPKGSAIKPGDELLVSAYTPVVVDSRQWVCCMLQNGLYDFFGKSIRAVNEVLHPRKWFLTLDEIRAGGSCGSCRSSGKTQAQILGDCVTRLRGIIKGLNSDAEIYIWHDMFDPQHNAVDNYCMSKSTYRKSWLYLPKDIIVCVWGTANAVGKLKFFSKQGFRTQGACFYDSDKEADFRVWAEMCRATDGCVGLMYTTWRKNFSELPAFMRAISETAR